MILFRNDKRNWTIITIGTLPNCMHACMQQLDYVRPFSLFHINRVFFCCFLPTSDYCNFKVIKLSQSVGRWSFGQSVSSCQLNRLSQYDLMTGYIYTIQWYIRLKLLDGNASSRKITEIKQRWARLVFGWETPRSSVVWVWLPTLKVG